MSLTPEQIAAKDFTVGLRGYDQDEVREYLQLLATEWPALGANLAASTADGSTGPALVSAAAVLERAHDESVEMRQSAAAEAEIARARARAVLSAAQQEALRLVAEAHARIERRGGPAPETSEEPAPTSTIEQLGEEISAMVKARDEVLEQLQVVQRRVDGAVEAAAADLVLGRASAIARS